MDVGSGVTLEVITDDNTVEGILVFHHLIAVAAHIPLVGDGVLPGKTTVGTDGLPVHHYGGIVTAGLYIIPGAGNIGLDIAADSAGACIGFNCAAAGSILAQVQGI